MPTVTLRPDGPVTSTWTPSAGASWQCVDEAVANGDTDYTSRAGGAAYTTELYSLSDTGLTVAYITRVQVKITLRKETATGNNDFESLLFKDGIYAFPTGGVQRLINDTAYHEYTFEYARTNPPGGVGTFDLTTLDGMAAGFDYDGLNWTDTVRVTKLEVVVTYNEVEDSLAVNVSESDAAAVIEFASDADDNAVNVTEADDGSAWLAADAANAAANVTESDAAAAVADDAENAAANVSESDAAAVPETSADILGANVTESDAIAVTGDFPGLRLRIDVYTPAGARLDVGALVDVLAFQYGPELGKIGAFSLDLPATSRQAEMIAQARELRVFREGEGMCFRGIVARAGWKIDASGRYVFRVTGDSIAIQLGQRSTLLGLAFQGATLAAAVGDDATSGTLLHDTGWAPGELAAPATTLLARFDGLSRWAALAKVAEIFGLQLREDNLDQEVDIIAPGDPSGLVFQNVEAVTPALAANPSLFPITSLEVDEQSEDLITTIVPLGAGEGLNQLDLRYSDRTSPYTIQSATGPDGRTYYYLEDAAAVTAYGRREEVVSVKDAIPLANSAAGFTAAANALYDVAAARLARAVEPLVTYRVAVAGLRHIGPSGAPLFELGQTVRVIYRGIVEDSTGARAWKSIDETLYLIGFTRTFKDDGSDRWAVTLANLDRADPNGAGALAQAFSDLRALQVALRNYTYHEVHILQRSSIDASNTATLRVKWDGNVSLLHQAKLTFAVRALRSNVTTASSGGGATSSAGGAQTSSSGGATTSSGGSSHSHSVSGSTSSAGGSHRHQFMHYAGSSHINNTGAPNVASTQDVSNAHTHVETGGTTGNNSTGHTHSLNSHTHAQTHSYEQYQMRNAAGSLVALEIALFNSVAQDQYTYETVADHTHTISGSTSGAEASHTHTVGNHTHTVADHTHTVPAHTHGITYGIFVASNPSNPAIHITINGTDRTTALGGPWNTVNGDVEVDITAYLQSGATERPLQQSNTIVFSGAVLADVEATLRSRVTASSLVPV